MRSNVKLTAIIFIFLITGHEAARTSQIMKHFHRVSGPVDDWKKEEDHCKLGRFGCGFYSDNALDPNKKGACKLVNLHKCRLTDTYMMKDDNIQRFAKLRTEVLQDNYDEFNNKCSHDKKTKSENKECRRLEKQIVRGLQFINKVHAESHSQIPEDVKKQMLDAQNSAQKVVPSELRSSFDKLKEWLKNKLQNKKKISKSTVAELCKITTSLTSADVKKQEEAKAIIADLDRDEATEPSNDDQESEKNIREDVTNLEEATETLENDAEVEAEKLEAESDETTEGNDDNEDIMNNGDTFTTAARHDEIQEVMSNGQDSLEKVATGNVSLVQLSSLGPGLKKFWNAKVALRISGFLLAFIIVSTVLGPFGSFFWLLVFMAVVSAYCYTTSGEEKSEPMCLVKWLFAPITFPVSKLLVYKKVVQDDSVPGNTGSKWKSGMKYMLGVNSHQKYVTK